MLYKDNKVMRPKLGEMVTITHMATLADTHHKWVEEELLYPRKGIYVGYRTKYNGSVYQDEGYRYFVPDESVRVWMVVVDERENPIEVFPHHATKVI